MSEIAERELLLKIKTDATGLSQGLKSAVSKLNNIKKAMQSEIKDVKVDLFPQQQKIKQKALEVRELLTQAMTLPKGTLISSPDGLMTKTNLRQKYQELTNQLKGLNIEQAKSINQIQKKYTPALQSAESKVDQLSSFVSENSNMYKEQQIAVEKAGLAAKKAQVPFAGYAMSIMFFGMALKRMFDQLWKFGSKTFQEISHSVENSTTGFDMLEGSVKYLGFTLGQALEPVVMWLAPIVDIIADWVTRNDKLVAGMIVLIGVLGTAFLVGGSGKLALDGFIGMKNAVGGLSKLLSPAGAVVAGLTVVAGLGWKAFNETPKAWESIKDSVQQIDFTPIKQSLEALINTLFPDAMFSFEDFTWTIAWGIHFSSKVLQAFIGLVGVLVNSLLALANASVLVGESLLAVGTGAILHKKVRRDISNRAAMLSQNISDVVSSARVMDVGFVYNTPGEYKEAYEGVGGFTPRQQQSQLVVNGNIYVENPSSFEQFVDEIYRGQQTLINNGG